MLGQEPLEQRNWIGERALHPADQREVVEREESRAQHGTVDLGGHLPAGLRRLHETDDVDVHARDLRRESLAPRRLGKECFAQERLRKRGARRVIGEERTGERTQTRLELTPALAASAPSIMAARSSKSAA